MIRRRRDRGRSRRQPLLVPRCSEQFDYEAEMVVVIGRKGRNIAARSCLASLEKLRAEGRAREDRGAWRLA